MCLNGKLCDLSLSVKDGDIFPLASSFLIDITNVTESDTSPLSRFLGQDDGSLTIKTETVNSETSNIYITQTVKITDLLKDKKKECQLGCKLSYDHCQPVNLLGRLFDRLH